MSFNKFDHTLIGEITPRFRLRVASTAQHIISAISDEISKDKTISGDFANQYGSLRIPLNYRNYWSPELQIHFRKDESFTDDTILHCIIGPAQSVWILHLFIYALIGLITLFGGMFGIVQYSLEKSSVFLLFWPFGIFMLFSIFFYAKLAQRKVRNQTLHLVSFLFHTLEKQFTVELIE